MHLRRPLYLAGAALAGLLLVGYEGNEYVGAGGGASASAGAYSVDGSEYGAPTNAPSSARATGGGSPGSPGNSGSGSSGSTPL